MIYDADSMDGRINYVALLYPGLRGLGLLPDPSMIPVGSSLALSNSGIPWSCSTFGLFCNTTQVQNQLDTSAFGGSLTQANKDSATQMAGNVITNDPNLQFDPSFLNIINPFTTANPSAPGGLNWWVIGSLVIGGIVLFKR